VLVAGLLLRNDGTPPSVAPPTAIGGDHPSVLFVVCDTLRADHTTIGGYGRDTTPNLARFAGDALVFDEARASSPWTKPSMATMLTGLPPGVHRTERFLDRLSEAATTVPEVLSAAGYATGLFSDNVFVSPQSGLAQGYAHAFHRLEKPAAEGPRVPRDSLLGRALSVSPAAAARWVGGRARRRPRPEYGAPKLNAAFLEWLDSLPPGRPFFAHLQYMEPHIPYTPPAPYDARFGDPSRKFTDPRHLDRGVSPFRRGEAVPDEARRAMIDAYDAEILWWDVCFGELLGELERRGLLDGIVVLFVSDHGEAFYEHGVWEHRNGLFEEVLRVPLVLRGPGVPKGRVPGAVSLDGVAETLVRLAGYEPPASMAATGHALLPAPAGDRATRVRFRYEDLISLGEVADGRKWIYSREGDRELMWCFDLAADPGERRDLAAARAEEGEEVRRRLLRRAEQEERLALEAGEAEVDDAISEMLRSNGYLR
jgi:arylsulfatase A-like enzyme